MTTITIHSQGSPGVPSPILVDTWYESFVAAAPIGPVALAPTLLFMTIPPAQSPRPRPKESSATAGWSPSPDLLNQLGRGWASISIGGAGSILVITGPAWCREVLGRTALPT